MIYHSNTCKNSISVATLFEMPNPAIDRRLGFRVGVRSGHLARIQDSDLNDSFRVAAVPDSVPNGKFRPLS
jgi:hypothetical protein